jgi:hypothetical protein
MIVATSSLPWETAVTAKSLELRLSVLKQALQQCRDHRVSLLCLPAGYFKVRSERERCKLGERVVELAKAVDIVVAAGVDVGAKGKKSKDTKKSKKRSFDLTRKQRRPSFALVSNPRERKAFFFRQRSVSSRDQHLVKDDVCAWSSAVLIEGKRVEILSCGEIFNARVREGVVKRKPKVDVVVDLGHKSAGFRVDGPLKFFASHHLWSFCAAHAKTHGAMKRAYAPGGKKKSSTNTDILVEGPPRLELKLWNI